MNQLLCNFFLLIALCFGDGFSLFLFLPAHFSRICKQSTGGGSWATGSALMTNADGSIDPNAQTHSYTHTSPSNGRGLSGANFPSGSNPSPIEQRPSGSFAQNPSSNPSDGNR